MYRRRHRRPREIAFSLDSFLDLVANVVGIIIRLILVAWVGARSYKAVTAIPLPEHATPAATAQAQPDDPAARMELDRNRKALQDTQERLLAELRKLKELQTGNDDTGKQLALLSATHDDLAKEQGELDRALKEHTRSSVTVAASLEDLRKRRERLDAAIRALEKEPSAKKVLRYRTPVSRVVHNDELHFECLAGRVAFVDMKAFDDEFKAWVAEKAQDPLFAWPNDKITSPVGSFRGHYFLEFTRDTLNNLLDGGPRRRPCGVHAIMEPLTVNRGENLQAALVPTSEFRQIVDALDPNTSVVTFWVYPDSFPVYRRLRDYLYERGIEVAGRPMLLGDPIGSSSSHGTRSRSQ